MDPTEPKPATPATAARNSAAVIDFDDDADLARATRGLVAQLPGGRVEVDGWCVWDVATHDFLREDGPAPDTVHPGLWRHGRLDAHHGLFEVAEGVWQARGYDISNITFLSGRDGWVIIDPLTTAATAAACLELANSTVGRRPVTAVIYTHSHVDHFGGVHGVTSEQAVAAGDVRIIAPEGFLAEAVSENGHAGPIMARRAQYQFGPLLASGPRGQVDNGIGLRLPFGMSGLIAPTETVSETGAELDVDGIRIVFQNAPDSEAPAEMNFFFPDLRLLCIAENCTHTLHNLYPIRGAKVRDALAWSRYLDEALVLWGEHTDVMFASHHWPRVGRDDVASFIALQRDVYRWMHDQTLRLANHGYTPDEIADELTLPDCFSRQSHVQGYYGTVSHNVRSVYDRYLGWYDGNPAKLHPLPPVDAATRYVELMGGADAVVGHARAAFDRNEYRWVVQLLNHVVFADPGHREARLLSADAMEQLGYQSESATWRNAYLMGAFELRHGTLDLGRARQPDVGHAMTGEQLIDAMGVRFDPARFREAATIVWRFDDLDEIHRMGVSNCAIHHRRLDTTEPDPGHPEADVVVGLDRATLLEAMNRAEHFDEMVGDGRITIDTGDVEVVREFLAALDVFMTQALIEP